MLSPTSPRKVLFAFLFFPPWNPFFFSLELTFSFACSRSDLPLFRQSAAFAYLDSFPPHNLVIWTVGSFPFGKGGSGVLANCSLCGTMANLSFGAGPVSSNFSSKACAIVQALRWSRRHQKVCHFSFLLLLNYRRC